MPFDRLIARDDFAEFNWAAADAPSGAPIKPMCCCRSDNGAGDFADASRAAIAGGKPYLSDANML
jgi:hypothetical protein